MAGRHLETTFDSHPEDSHLRRIQPPLRAADYFQ